MPSQEAVSQVSPQLDADFVYADAAYFRNKAKQCLRLADRSGDAKAARTLRSLANAFEAKARMLAH
jgi:hypothetical protein